MFVGIAVLCASPAAQRDTALSQRADKVITVVVEPKFYVIGVVDHDEMQLFNEADPKRMWKVDGLILHVITPPEYAGQIIGMHHDGVLASGNPYTLWEVGRRYELRMEKENIGKLSFGPCSLQGTRKVLPK